MKKSRTRRLSIILVVLVLFSCFQTNVFAKTSKPKLSKTKITMNKGESFKVKLKNSKGKIKWTSSKKSIASVSSKGIIKAQKKGTAIITAKYKNKKYKCKVKVETPKLNHSCLFLPLKSNYKLQLIGSSQQVRWSSSNNNIVTVNNGVVTAVEHGNAFVYAKVGNTKYKCSIQVGKYTIKENYSILREYMIKYGYKNTNGDYVINQSNIDENDLGNIEYIFGVIYSPITETFEFLLTGTSETDRYPYTSVKFFVAPDSLSDNLDIIYTMKYNNSNGGMASTSINAKLYERKTNYSFTIDSISGLTSSYLQEGANLGLDLMVSSCNVLLLECLNMDLSDFGFLSIYD